MRSARTLRDFDDVVTAPMHGFRDVDDYWTRASAKPHLGAIRVPTLLLNARDDPFLPEQLPAARTRGLARGRRSSSRATAATWVS